MRTISVTSAGDDDTNAADHASRVIDWVEALGVNHRTVKANQAIQVGDTSVTFQAFTLDAEGKRLVNNARDGFAEHTAVVPLAVDPAAYGL